MRTRTRLRLAAIASALALTALAAPARASAGTVNVLYAGSLVAYMENQLGPAFHRATGFGFAGFGGGSTEVANQIKGGVRRGDVFVSASANADKALEGGGNGNWVSWYSTFAATPLMLAYNPHSSFAGQLRRGVPWYRVIAESGIRVGRTDPRLDPKGVLTVEAVRAAERKLHDPALGAALSRAAVFPETALVGRLQAGQLDAGFFYAVEAAGAHLVTVPLTPAYKYAEYTVTILHGARNAAGASSFVRFLLSASQGSSLRRNGLNPQTPAFHGSASAVPAALRRAVGAR